MLLYLLRHGEAEAPVHGQRDMERALTPAGRVRIERMARVLPTLLTPPAKILTSPFLRARQTSEIVGHALGLVPEVVPHLHPETGYSDVKFIAEVYATSPLLLVFHQPALARFVEQATQTTGPIHPGTLVVVETPPDLPLRAGRVVSVYHPTDFDLLATP